jgi:hypothetical protein
MNKGINTTKVLTTFSLVVVWKTSEVHAEIVSKEPRDIDVRML